MIETHALVLLRPELRTSPEARNLNWFNGLVAPSFIFAAGFSLALVQVRGAHGARWPRVRRSLRRIGEVLAVGLLINAIWFPWRQQPDWLLRLDILPCIGSVAAARAAPARRLARQPVVLSALSLLVALGIFGVTPYGEAVRGPWADVVNHSGHPQSGVPAAAVGGLRLPGSLRGSAVGGRERPPHPGVPRHHRGHRGRVLPPRALLHGLLPAAPVPCLEPGEPRAALHDRVAGAHRAPVVRAGCVGAVAQSLGVRFVETLGMSSLAGYFFHEMLLYYQVCGISFAGLARDKLGWGLYLVSWLGLVPGHHADPQGRRVGLPPLRGPAARREASSAGGRARRTARTATAHQRESGWKLASSR